MREHNNTPKGNNQTPPASSGYKGNGNSQSQQVIDNTRDRVNQTLNNSNTQKK